jgi:hypothetical protein
MLALEIANQWLSGKAIPYGYNTGVPLVGDLPVDIVGTAITVGKMVKMIGVVVAVNNNDTHFQDIQVIPQFPQSSIVTPTSGTYPQSIPAPGKVLSFHPLELMVVGSQY